MTIEKKVRSLFDINIGGTPTELGYVVLMRDIKTDELYGIKKDDWYNQLSQGESLQEGCSENFGEGMVCAMTYEQEVQWNQGNYDGLGIVDLWGNIKSL